MSQDACEYFVVRYFDNPIRQEPKNIGVVMRVPGSNPVIHKLLSGRDLRAKLAGLPELETQVLNDSLIDFQRKLVDVQQRNLFEKLTSSSVDLSGAWVGNIEITTPRRVVSENPAKDLQFLFETFVQPVRRDDLRPEYQLKQDLRQDLLQHQMLARGRELKENCFVSDPEIKSKHSGVKHRVDFAMQNGKLTVIETVDMRKKSVQELERETFGAALKLDDLKKSFTKFEGYALVAGNTSSGDNQYFVKVLNTYTDRLVNYSDVTERNKFLKQISRAVGNR